MKRPGRSFKVQGITLVGALGLLLSARVSAQGAGYEILKSAPLAGDGGWDFLSVDPVQRRVYVTHADSVQVLDADSLHLLGTISDVPRPHGVVALSELGLGFVSSGDPGSVVVFDLKTLKKTVSLSSSKDTDVILYEPATAHIFTFNGDSGDATVIDPSTQKVITKISLGGEPEVAVADGKGTLYDNLANKNQLIKINAKTLKIEQRWSTAPGTEPTGLAMDSAHGLLFIGCRNKLLVVMDSATGKVLQTLPIGEHVDSTVFDAATGNIFNSCGDGTLAVAHEDTPTSFSVVEDAKTEAGARTMALDAKTGVVFTDTAQMEPAPVGAEKGHRKPIPGTFHVLVIGR
jgi:YVTN family beta-propeller protein